MTTESLPKVDHSGLKVGQVATILLLIAAYVLDSPLLVAVVAVCQLLGAADAPFAPYRLLYRQVIKPLGIVKPHVIADNPEPHRFAMLVGGLMNAVGALLIASGAAAPVGWILVVIVILLANLNLWIGFCAGCWMYYQFNRLGVPGFTRAKIGG